MRVCLFVCGCGCGVNKKERERESVCVCVLDSQTYCLCGDRFVCVCRHKRLHTVSNFMCVSNTHILSILPTM